MSKSRIVQIGLIQTTSGGDPAASTRKTADLIRKAADRGAQIVCTQELYRSDYFCQKEDPALFDLAEIIPGPSTEAFGAVAREKGIVIIASLFEKRAAGLYHNTVAVLNTDGSVIGLYRKMHIPDDPAFYEKYYFTPGDLGFKSFDTPFGRIGVLICWDQWYPEAARLTALAGAEILFYPTAIGWALNEDPKVKKCQHDAWHTIQRSHAIANGVFVASVNRTGTEGGHLEFWGQSFVCDPFGEVLCQAAPDREEILVVPCDLGEVDHTRRHWPFMRDRRIDAYGDITKRYLEQV